MSDSDDSDGEGGLGNVSRVLVRPPGHSGKAKRGHLCFDAAFETGNLGRVDLVSECEYDLFIRPDTCSPKFRLWFNFTVDNFKHDQRVIFNIVNISKSKNLFRDGMTPLVKSTSRPKWQRIPKKHVWFHRSNAHQSHHVLSFTFAFDREEEVFQFAMAAPYSYSRLQAYLTTLQRRHPEYVSIEKIGSSVQDRRVDLVTIGNAAKAENINDNKKRVIVVIARTHPGESPSSYVCQGLLELLSSEHQVAQTLREHVIFKVVPMLNPDGVFLGNYRSTLMGFDLNRSWNIASPWGHPTLTTVIKMLKALDSHELYQLDFVVDIHAHSSLTGAFIYGNTYEDIYRYERHIVFPKLLAGNADDYITEHSMFNADVAKVGTARRHICTMFADRVNSYTLEVSLYAYRVTKGEGTILVPYNEEAYMRLGRNFTRTFIDYYKVVGVILSGPTQELSARGRRPLTHRSKRRKPRSASLQRPRTTQRYNALVKYMDLTNCDPLSDEECELQYYPNSFFTKHSKSLFEGDSTFSMLFRYKAGLPTPNQDSGFVTSSSTNVKQVGGGAFIGQGTQRHGSPIPQVFTVPQAPSLSIIDFNQLTRGSLEEAIERSRKVDGRSARSYK